MQEIRTLIVQRDAALLQSWQLALKASGFLCFGTDLGEEAIDLAGRYDFEIILMDDYLHDDMSGIAVTRAVRAAGVETPILHTTTIVDIEYLPKVLEAGADSAVVIPFEFSHFIALARAMVRRERRAFCVAV